MQRRFPASAARHGCGLPGQSVGLVVIGILVLSAGGFGLTGELQAQRLSPPPAGPLWIADSPLDDGRRLVIVVDTGSRHAAVYHVDAASGSLTLKSARDLSWDLTLGDFNAQEPKPAALKKLLEAGGRP